MAALGVLVPALALAQSPAPFDPAIDVQTFDYAIGPKSFFTVSDADVADKKQLAVDALVTFMTQPFKIYDVDKDTGEITGTRTTVVESVTAMQLTAAYGINERLQIGANLPLIFSLRGEGLMPNTGDPSCGMPPCLNVTGLGDLAVEGKYRLYKQGNLKVAGLGAVTLPTSFGSDGSKFIGDNLPTLRGRIAVQLTPGGGKFSVGANAGFLLRKPRTIYDSTIGQQVVWGVGATFRITDRLAVIGESYGRAGLPDFSLDASPLEAIGGLRLYATSSVAVVVGGGAGLVRGIGSPGQRYFISVGYAPDVRDSDGDGIPNGRDRCLLVPEDKDGAMDDDGCPDDDNDGDRRTDDVDKCPETAEDLDGFDDDDGCPELDNDGDGLPDLEDKCMNDAEDGKPPAANDGCPASKRDSDGDEINDLLDQCPAQEEDADGFEDGDGCPEPDNDTDGVADAEDKCALCPEDRDGFEDGDGCPELDNDRDGVADARDVCPKEAETLNGVKDDDGCPDTGGNATVKYDGDKLVIDKVPTMRRKVLTAAGAKVVDQIALVMIGNPEVTKWLIALAQPKAADAQQLGDAIKTRLVSQGVPAERVELLVAAGSAKIGGVVKERGEAGAPVCPAGSEVTERPEAVKKPAPGAEPTPEPAKPKPEPAKPAEPEIEIE
jgi:hypothetical protein